MDIILANYTISITELKRNFASVLKEAGNSPVAVLNHNRPEAYLLSASHYAQLLAEIEDLQDAVLVQQRAAGPFVAVNLDDL